MIAFFQDGLIAVATDTLATDLDGRPTMFVSKTNILAHIDTIIVGTGAAEFANEWALEASTMFRVSGIRNLDYHTSARLRDRWKAFREANGVDEEFTTTVYQFGFDEIDQSVCGFAYRSVSDFESEALEPGLRLKPECEPVQTDNLEADFEIMMREQRRINDLKKKENRVCIGGKCIIHFLSPGLVISKTLFTFDDYESDLEIILKGG